MLGTISFLRMIWPFLREVVFGRDSVKAWVKKNGITLVWLLLVVTMLAVVLKMVILLNKETTDITTLTAQKTDLEKQLEAAKTTEAGLQAQLSKLTKGHEPNPGVGVTGSSYPPPPPRLNQKDQALYDRLKQLSNKGENEEN